MLTKKIVASEIQMDPSGYFGLKHAPILQTCLDLDYNAHSYISSTISTLSPPATSPKDESRTSHAPVPLRQYALVVAVAVATVIFCQSEAGEDDRSTWNILGYPGMLESLGYF